MRVIPRRSFEPKLRVPFVFLLFFLLEVKKPPKPDFKKNKSKAIKSQKAPEAKSHQKPSKATKTKNKKDKKKINGSPFENPAQPVSVYPTNLSTCCWESCIYWMGVVPEFCTVAHMSQAELPLMSKFSQKCCVSLPKAMKARNPNYTTSCQHICKWHLQLLGILLSEVIKKGLLQVDAKFSYLAANYIIPILKFLWAPLARSHCLPTRSQEASLRISSLLNSSDIGSWPRGIRGETWFTVWSFRVQLALDHLIYFVIFS